MKQYEAVIKTMEENGGYATLGYLYQHTLGIPHVVWRTKTPHASIRRIVQDTRYFFRIRPGLWALNSFQHKLPADLMPKNLSKKVNEDLNHTYYQGLLVEIGNIKQMNTYIPPQDKNKSFLGNKLTSVVSVHNIYSFGYSHTVEKAKTIDVIWFNDRNMPFSFFEVEHTTNMQNSLLKFLELRDFHTQFYIVASKTRERLYDSKINLQAFVPIQKRVKFLDYEKLSLWHAKTHELHSVEHTI